MWDKEFLEVIDGVVRPWGRVPRGDQLRGELRWTRAVLIQCHNLGHEHVTGYDIRKIETYPVGLRLVIVRFRYPEPKFTFEGPY